MLTRAKTMKAYTVLFILVLKFCFSSASRCCVDEGCCPDKCCFGSLRTKDCCLFGYDCETLKCKEKKVRIPVVPIILGVFASVSLLCTLCGCICKAAIRKRKKTETKMKTGPNVNSTDIPPVSVDLVNTTEKPICTDHI